MNTIQMNKEIQDTGSQFVQIHNKKSTKKKTSCFGQLRSNTNVKKKVYLSLNLKISNERNAYPTKLTFYKYIRIKYISNIKDRLLKRNLKVNY